MNIDRQKVRRFFFGPGALIIIFGYLFYVVWSFFSDFELCPVPEDAVRINDSVYHVSEGKIYSEGRGVQFVDGAFGCANPFTVVPNADTPSFVAINRMYGKDGNNVFFYEKEIAIDPRTATSVRSEIDPRYFRDGSLVFYRTSEYVKDAESVFFRLKKVDGIKAENASLLNLGDKVLLRDELNVSFASDLLVGANPDNLKIKTYRPDSYSALIHDEDQAWILSPGQATYLDGADPETIEYLGESGYLRDVNSIFYSSKMLNVDRNTFEVLGEGYLRDKDGVYCHEWKKEGGMQTIQIPGADPYTFKILNRTYSKDQNNVYYSNCTFANKYSRVITGADVHSFEALTESQAQDKDYVYEGENQTRKRW